MYENVMLRRALRETTFTTPVIIVASLLTLFIVGLCVLAMWYFLKMTV